MEYTALEQTLLEACQMALDSQAWDGNNPDDDRWTLLYATLRKAIQKAKEEREHGH